MLFKRRKPTNEIKKDIHLYKEISVVETNWGFKKMNYTILEDETGAIWVDFIYGHRKVADSMEEFKEINRDELEGELYNSVMNVER